LLVKTDSNGNKLWNNTFGGTADDVAAAILPVSGGGYIIAGYTDSYGAGNDDVWLIKTDSNGTEIWNKTFGGTGDDNACSVQRTLDDGYIIAGFTDSYGAGNDDVWLIKTDSNGTEIWNKTIGGLYSDLAYSAPPTTDGSYIIAGCTYSFGAGEEDFWLVKTDSNGTEIWNETFGGNRFEFAKSVKQTSDGGYIIAGYTDSFGAGKGDVLLVKTDANGTAIWNKTFGGTETDMALSVQRTIDNGYIIAGSTKSYGAGLYDAWIVKTNGNGTEIWNKTFGGNSWDTVTSIKQTICGGYILAGYTYSYGAGSSDLWLIRVKGESTELSVHNIDTGKNFLTIQAAIEDPSTENGHTIIVDAGTYYENVNVTKRLILMGVDTGSGKPVVDAGGNGSAVTLSADGITLKGFNVTNSRIGAGAGAGIKVNSSYNNITGNIASNNHYGIYLSSSRGNNITGNTASNNIGDGILLYFSCNNNTITGNKGCNNSIHGSIFPYCGIHLYSSSNNTITGNCLSNNKDRGIRLWSSSNNTITGNNVSNNRDGITLWYICTHNTITGNNVSNNDEGISLFHSSNNNSVIDNNVSNNDEGILLYYSSSNNTIRGNNARNNSYGIRLSDSSSNNAVTSNNISNNGGGIIFCHSSNNNTVTGNKVRNNNYYGIYLPLSDSNKIYLNNFMNNTDNVYSYNSTNIWNSTKEITHTYNGSTHTNYMGNYWSDYEEKYPDAEEIDETGIWDMPYSIDPVADNYPLMVLWENYFAPLNIFDTGSPANPYPSISGTHNGTITLNQTITVSKLYTYPCAGTGGHTEYARIWNSTLNVTAKWYCYVGNGHNISFNESFTLVAGETYSYSIRTGSYPQIHHTDALLTTNGWINCTVFTDANGKKYDDGIPAIRLWSE
jgi:parallel beta-helix repeat protein